LRYGTDPTTTVMHPYSSACTIYTRTTTSTVFPFCDLTGTCTQGNPSGCRLTSLPATLCTASQIDVNNRGTRVCATSGAIPGCFNYSTFVGSTVSQCIDCEPGWTLVNNTNSVIICARILIEGCKRYYPNGFCF